MALLFFAVVWFTVGFGIIDMPNPPGATHALPLEYLPVWFRVALWFGAAVCAVVAAFWPKGQDKWGWVALGIPASLRVVSYGVAVLVGWIEPRYFFSWVFILGLVMLLASWPETLERQTDEA
jgi:hypothetical protein